jgi:nucleoside-diphosphate-sugar epimerase
VEKNKKKIIISGVTGFTGSVLSTFLSYHQYEIYAIKRDRDSQMTQNALSFNEIDLGNPIEVERILSSGNVAAVIHLATVYSRKEQLSQKKQIWDANYLVGSKLLELSISAKLHFFHIESYLQFESLQDTEYLKSKRAFSRLIDQEREKNRIGITSLIFFDNYGELDKRNKILDQLIKAKLEGQSVLLENGKRVIILTWIQDVVASIIESMHRKEFGRYRVNGLDKYLLSDLGEFVLHYPHVNEPVMVEEQIYQAETFPILGSFRQTRNLFEYIRTRLSEKPENNS